VGDQVVLGWILAGFEEMLGGRMRRHESEFTTWRFSPGLKRCPFESGRGPEGPLFHRNLPRIPALFGRRESFDPGSFHSGSFHPKIRN
jgi:hypothetical protein